MEDQTVINIHQILSGSLTGISIHVAQPPLVRYRFFNEFYISKNDKKNLNATATHHQYNDSERKYYNLITLVNEK